MSKHYEMVKGFYVRGLWNEARVLDAVVRGWITEEEYYNIVRGTS